MLVITPSSSLQDEISRPDLVTLLGLCKSITPIALVHVGFGMIEASSCDARLVGYLSFHIYNLIFIIGLITVFDAILTGRQTGLK